MRRAFLIVTLLILGFMVGWFARSKRPEYPGYWDNLELGMTVRQAHETVPRLDDSLRAIKGFDQEGFDYGDRYWILLVSYNSEGRVGGIEKKYVDRRIGIFNRSIVETR